ncbi:patatin-like phospholipase family protein [Arenicella xantha]|uniref:NTE family protein n=1 Tax=Arenicella xantha TaxID=644221 RepID=A0A395JHF7_9GAMM|nr:patatin-like phospholipase family protein [Arenicella xantha]RBP48885.1 NTE family protein [Arenicella xantha]
MVASSEPTTEVKKSRSALLLGGGGARAAYQVGVLKAIAELVPEGAPNPFPIICGTSAGSINTVALASNAEDFHHGVDQIISVWSNFELNQVFYADGKSLFKRIAQWAWSNLGPGTWHKGPSSILDNQPLRELLNKYISFERIDNAIESGHLHGYALTACSYTSGESTTFYDGVPEISNWLRNHREGQREKMNIEHLMASSAIPVLFPSVKLGDEHFGDGSMRQISPISPALHLGAEKILIIGLRTKAISNEFEPPLYRPTLGQISGYVLDTLFLNSLQSDIERMERMNRTLIDGTASNGDSLKVIEHLVISPSLDIANIAMNHFLELPKSFRIALRFLGMAKANSRRLISYLMFTKTFCQELIELGYNDAMAQRDEIIEFLEK